MYSDFCPFSRKIAGRGVYRDGGVYSQYYLITLIALVTLLRYTWYVRGKIYTSTAVVLTRYDIPGIRLEY